MDAATIAKHYGGRRSGGSYVLKACPVCGYRDTSVKDGDGGRLLFACPGNNCSFADLMAALRAQGIVDGRANANWTPPSRRTTAEKDAKAEAMAEMARKLWTGKTVPAPGTIVDTAYLPGRGVTMSVPPTIRFAPALKHKPTGLVLPAMVAAFARWPDNKVCAIHRTYLTADGRRKAPVTQSKMTLGPVAGAAIRLAAAGPVLIVAEGIETTLSAMQATDLPGWAAFSAGNMRELILPPLPLAAEVIVAADNDENGVGQNAARAAAERWHAEGRKVRIALPPTAGTDWNDLIQGEAA